MDHYHYLIVWGLTKLSQVGLTRVSYVTEINWWLGLESSQTSSLICLIVDASCQLELQLGLLIKQLHMASPCDLAFTE